MSDPACRLLRLVVPVLTGVWLSSCGTDTDDFSRCSPPLAITVTQSPLTFAWEPTGCDVNALTVVQGNTVTIKWHIGANPDRNSIESPVQYGVAPNGVDDALADTLSAGPYTVQVTRLNAAGTALEISKQDFSFVGP